MSLTTRTLSNAGAPLCAPDGAVLANTEIVFQLVDANNNPCDAWDASTHERVAGTIKATTDASGLFSVALWPNVRSASATRYRCRVQGGKAADVFGSVPEGTSTLSWYDFMAGGAPLSGQAIAYKQGDTISLAGTVLLPSGTWGASANLCDSRNQLAAAFSVDLTPLGSPTADATHAITLSMSADTTRALPVGQYQADVLFEDALANQMHSPTFHITLGASQT